MDEQLLKYLPSQIAAASVYLARQMLNRQPWDATLAHYSQKEESEVSSIAADLAFTHAQIQSEGQFTAILEKYSSERLRNVSSMAPCERILARSERFQQYQQQQAAANSSSADDSPIAGCFCSDMSSDMELV